VLTIASRELKVEIIGDSRSFEKALGQAGNASTGFSSKFSKAARVVGLAALGMGAAVAGGLVVTLKRGFDELESSQKVAAQTAAGIKSTGAAANVTAKQVANLATSISKLSGIDDEDVQASENMLLTFTKVRNEVGKGNNVFDQATQAIADMATRMNNGAIPSAEQLSKTAIQVGKALNDPIKGLGSLARVGVQFTEGQKATIESLVKSGQTMEAQKLILKELTTEFGGSAKAAGETLPGQLAKARNAFDEMAGNLATKLLPVLTSVLAWINSNWPQINRVMETVSGAVGRAIGSMVDVVKRNLDTIKSIGTTAFDGLRTAAERVGGFFRSEFGQQVAAGVAVLYGLVKAIAAVKAAWLLASKSLKFSPWTAALIPLAFAIGAATQKFIKQKVAAIELDAALRQAAGGTDALKAAQDRLKQTALDVDQANINVKRTTDTLIAANAAYVASSAKHGASSKDAKDKLLTLNQAIVDNQQALLDQKNAVDASKKAQSDYANQFNVQREAVLKTSDSLRKWNTDAVFASKGADLLTQRLGPVIAGAEATAISLAKTDPAASKAKAKVALLGEAAVGLAKDLGRVPERKEIIARAKAVDFNKFYASLLELGRNMDAQKDKASASGYLTGYNLGSGAAAGIAASKAAAILAAGQMVIDMVAAMNTAAATGSESKKTIKLGKDMSEGLILGLLRGAPETNQKARDRVISAIQAMASALDTLKTLPQFEQIRAMIAEKIGAAGTIIDQARMAERMKVQLDRLATQVEAAKTRLAAAFQTMADYALKAFDARTDAGLAGIQRKLDAALARIQAKFDAATKRIETTRAAETPAERALRELDQREAQRQREQNLTAATQAIAAATTPEEMAAAQEQWRQAMLAIDRAGLEEQARIEREAADKRAADAQAKADAQLKKDQDKATARFAQQRLNYQAERDLLRSHLEKWLAIQEAALEAGNKQWVKVHNQLMKKFKDEFGPDYETAGKNLGAAFAQGLESSMDQMGSAAKKLAKLIADYLRTGSPTKKGPMSTLDKWWGGFVPALMSGLDTRGLTGFMNTLGPGAGGMRAMAGGTVINVHVAGHVTSERDLALALRDHLVNHGRYSGGSVFAGQA